MRLVLYQRGTRLLELLFIGGLEYCIQNLNLEGAAPAYLPLPQTCFSVFFFDTDLLTQLYILRTAYKQKFKKGKLSVNNPFPYVRQVSIDLTCQGSLGTRIHLRPWS